MTRQSYPLFMVSHVSIFLLSFGSFSRSFPLVLCSFIDSMTIVMKGWFPERNALGQEGPPLAVYKVLNGADVTVCAKT